MFKLTFVIGIATLLSSGICAGPIANGGFETGDFSGWSLGGACSGFPVGGGPDPCWSFVQNTVPNGTFGTYTAALGSQPPAGTIDQVISLPAGPWTINFELEVTTGTPPGNGIFDPASFFNVLWGGSQVLGLSNLPAQGWTTLSADVVSNGSPTDLMFQFRQDLSGNFYFDQVDATQGSSQSAVPEPGTIALLGVGLAGLAFIRRRSR